MQHDDNEAELDEGEVLRTESVLPHSLNGVRADAALAAILGEDWSRSRIKRTCLSLQLDGRTIKLSEKVSAGARLTAVLTNTTSFADLIPENLPLDIVHEDDEIIVINKAWGMAVHPSPGTPTGTVVNALLAHCRSLPSSDPLRPGIVHRLDKDTSGLLVCAKTERARLALSEAFEQRQVRKHYTAIVRGRMSPRQDVIDAPLGRDPVNRTKQAVVSEGREARTGYHVIEEFVNHSVLDIDLLTGRTHQIRVHLSWKGRPIIGDPLYSRSDALADRLCLAAVSLAFTHPVDGKELEFTAPLPPHMLEALARLRTGDTYSQSQNP